MAEGSNELSISSQAMSFLGTLRQRSSTNQIAVIVFAGPCRTGKSFLANRYLAKMRGFKVGHDLMQGTTTSGVWLWSETVQVSEECEALVLDCEGLNSEDRSYEVDVKIFALCMLLASQFVFNSNGSITETTLGDLSVVQLMAEEIKVRDFNPTGGSDEGEFSKYFPTFTWVLRDFPMAFKNLTPQGYMEQSLENDTSGIS